MRNLSIKIIPLLLLRLSKLDGHKSALRLRLHNLKKFQSNFRLLLFQTKVREYGTQHIGGFLIVGLPNKPLLMTRILRLIFATICPKAFIKQVRDCWAGLPKPNPNCVINGSGSVLLRVTASFSGDRYVPIGVDHSSKISVGSFHALFYLVTPRGECGKKRAGRLLGGREWSQFPELKNQEGGGE